MIKSKKTTPLFGWKKPSATTAEMSIKVVEKL